MNIDFAFSLFTLESPDCLEPSASFNKPNAPASAVFEAVNPNGVMLARSPAIPLSFHRKSR
jgi:hypothetical protein